MKYKIDNIKNYSKTRSWIFGHFFPKDSLLHSDKLEVKYHHIKPGYSTKEHYHPNGKQIEIIVKGKIKISLDGKEQILKEGDFLVTKNNIKERVIKVFKPTVLIGLRMPSKPNNKVNI